MTLVAAFVVSVSMCLVVLPRALGKSRAESRCMCCGARDCECCGWCRDCGQCASCCRCGAGE